MVARVIVVLGGGGALGAFECGVWKTLAPLLSASGASVLGLAGASIGAINAAIMARHGQDLVAGAEALERVWREKMSTPSFPFTALLGNGRHQRSWNGVLTGLLLGNSNLYQANPLNWNPLAGLNRLERPLMDRRKMWAFLEEELSPGLPVAGPGDPLLGVSAVDILSGRLQLFHNAEQPVTVAHLTASSAIPFVFEPVLIDGRWHWDGDMARQSLLPLFLETLQARGRLGNQGDDEDTLLITVDQLSLRQERLPRSGLEMAYRAMELLMQGKMEGHSPTAHGLTQVIRITREPLEHDAISGQFDYSIERIDELIAQGQRQAAEAWAAWQERGQHASHPRLIAASRSVASPAG